MNSLTASLNLHLWWRIHVFFFFNVFLLFFTSSSEALNLDGVLLLSFKYSIVNDPLNVLKNWNYNDQTPCSWNGVGCGSLGGVDSEILRVVSLKLPNSLLQGSISANLGLVEHLQSLDLSNNSINGSLPLSLFNATNLQYLDLSDNMISGTLPETVSQLVNLRFLNLSDNSLSGRLPGNFNSLGNLRVVSFSNNYLDGELPNGGFNSIEVLDLSSNLINGSLPRDFGGNNLYYFNISYNKLSGSIPSQFGANFRYNATLDVSYNNLRGPIPDTALFSSQKITSYVGNGGLCGYPTKTPCPTPSSPSIDASSSPTSPPAIAAIPKTVGFSPENSPPGTNQHRKEQSGFKTGTIVGIIIGDVVGVTILGIIFFYVYKFKRKKHQPSSQKPAPNLPKDNLSVNSVSSTSSESKGFTRWSCLRKREHNEHVMSDSSSDTEEEPDVKSVETQSQHEPNKGGTLVTVDGERELELETLLKASAYILGATGSSIMYKAVLEDGTCLAVRRIGENHLERFRDFESQVRVIAKLVHPNLVQIRGFFWGVDEKLIIYDFMPNGSLASARYKKVGSSPCHMLWEVRLKVAKGVARGLSYLHDKKHVHGNLKPSNILLGFDMEPKIGDFGLERLVAGDISHKSMGSTRNFGSKRSSASRDGFQDISAGPSPSPSPSSIGVSPYYAPESLRSLKPHPKWDVYSFGVIFLELLTGKVIVVDELGQGNNGLMVEDKNRALRMADVAIRGELEGKEEALLSFFKLGYSCASPIPHKRPTMKEVVQVLEKFPSSSSSKRHGH